MCTLKYEILWFLTIIFVLNASVPMLHAQCDTRSMAPFVELRGDLLCWDTGIPTDVEVLEFLVDGSVCPPSEYDFVYPYGTDGYYKLDFWTDNTNTHDLQICVRATCGGNTATGGFSEDGTNPSPCSAEIVFPAYSAVMIAPIFLNAPVPAASSALSMILLFHFSFCVFWCTFRLIRE